MTDDKIDALRRYATGDLAWKQLSESGWTYSQVLDGLGALGLRPPTVAESGLNAAALARGQALIRNALSAARR